jgi:elongation factor P
MAIKIDGAVFIITQFTHVTPGNLRAFVQVKLKRMSDGNIVERRFRSGEEVEQVDLDRRGMEFLYAENSGLVFMDSENYDQVTISKDVLGNAVLYLKPNTQVTVLFADGKPVSVELPNTIDLEVVDTPPGIKGATATNQNKEATLETGLKTRVPPFIEIGEKIRISTETGEYQSRA